jgi:hypothetical protein
MSDRNFQSNKNFRQNTQIAVLNIVLNFILPRGWIDYDNFASNLAKQILKSNPSSEEDIKEILRKTNGTFFRLNDIDKGRFTEAFPSKEIIRVIQEQIPTTPLTFIDVFQETTAIPILEGKGLVPSLEKLPERNIQEALLDSLREKNATNPHERHRDTVLEIADLEHFILSVKNRHFSFACVVKGYKSISRKTVTWKEISHQITKAYQGTFPDYLLIVLAKDPADGLITKLINYAKSVGNSNLIIICDPVNLARFLRAREAI